MTHAFLRTKCGNCENDNEEGYYFCKNCITKIIRVCTCEKKFIEETPTIVNIGNKNHWTVMEIPEVIPDFFLTKLNGNIYHILGCRGCKFTKKEISVQDDFLHALQASITSCVYQKVENGGKFEYMYMSDSLDADFEEYLEKNGIRVGEPVGIQAD